MDAEPMTTGPEAMPDQPNAGYPVPLSPMFIWGELKATQGEYNRRLDAVNVRLDQLDQHGTRGVDALRTEVRQLRLDMEAHEKAHERERAEHVAARRWYIGTVAALLVPLYPLIGYVILRLARG